VVHTSEVMTEFRPFDALTPDLVLTAVESTGLCCDGRMLALNSYENRVYQVGIEAAEPVVVKFYRPRRWSREQIQEEHDFLDELALAELPVVAPVRDQWGQSIHLCDPYLFTVFPRRGGRLPELDFDTLHAVGQTLGKLHSIGSLRPFMYRPGLSIKHYGDASCHFLLEHDFIPAELHKAYATLTADLLQRIGELMHDYRHVATLRLHGDCHPGNILWRDGPLLVDFDDCQTGPAMQDLWMLLSGERDQQQGQLAELIDGYATFYDFDPAELALVEALRTLRVMHYSAWLARRWDDPAFPRSFPWFNTPRYWAGHILELREQLAALDEPPLKLF
jgi:Ser/Thr protein kinase RdoA (MazF antagonist)